MISALQFFAMAAGNEAPDPYSTWGTPENALLLVVCAILFGIWATVMYRDIQKNEQKHLDRLRGILGPQWEVVSKEKCDESHELYGNILYYEGFGVTFYPICKRHTGGKSQWLLRFYGRPLDSSPYVGAQVAIERIRGRKLPRCRLLVKPLISPFKSPQWFRDDFPDESRTCLLEMESDKQQVGAVLPYLFRLGRTHDCLIAIETSEEYIACVGQGETDEDGYRKVLAALAAFSRDLQRFEAPV